MKQIIEVLKCEDCPLFSRDIDDSEYCSKGGEPEDRYTIGGWEPEVPKLVIDIPKNCPLYQTEITVKLRTE